VKYEQHVEKARRRIGELAMQTVDERDARIRWVLMMELRQLESVLPSLEAELDRLVTHFKTWRASKITTRTETYQRCFNLDTLRGANVNVTANDVVFAGSAHQSVRAAWNQLGVAVTMRQPGVPKDSIDTATNEILVRIPRREIISVYEKGEDGKPVLREEKPHLVMDSACEVEVIALRKSAWAKRSTTLGFSELGGVTTYKHQADAAAAAAADTLGALPGTVSGSLEQAVKIRTQVAALRSSELDRQLDQAKKRVELKQQELTAAGLKATEKDAAELERLKQQAEMADKRKALETPPAPSEAATELAALKQEIELTAARLENDRLRAQVAANAALKPPPP
jgi:hypothetical protein